MILAIYIYFSSIAILFLIIKMTKLIATEDMYYFNAQRHTYF